MNGDLEATNVPASARDAGQVDKQAIADLEAMSKVHEAGSFCSRRTADFHQCLRKILSTAIAITGADKGNIQLLDAHLGILKIAAQHGFDQPFLDFFAEVDREDASACGAAMQMAGRVVVEDITESEIFSESPATRVLLNEGVRAVQSTPLLSSEGNVLGMISIHFSQPHVPSQRELRLVDLLARQAADFLERKRAEDALCEADRRKDEFLAILAHELRNPLTPLLYSLQFLRQSGASKERSEIYEMMGRQVNQMVRLVDDLMEVPGITRGKIILRKQPVLLAEFIRDAMTIPTCEIRF